jgi:hypothetical protein
MRKRFSSGFGSKCECICHNRASTNGYCGYCSNSHVRSHGGK